MFSLPCEVQLDILKYLNFNQLSSVRQTNFYFRNLINKYEGELSRREFSQLSIINTKQNLKYYKIIDLQSGIFEFTLDDQLEEKWQTAIDKSVPLFLNNSGPGGNFVCIAGNTTDYLLKLPTFPKNIDEMIIVRCWLEQLFNCVFDIPYFDECVFNPEMINILFDNDKTIPLQFITEQPSLRPDNETFENVLKFSLNYLSISESLNVDLDYVDITEKEIDILFNILTNEGAKLKKIWLDNFNLARLYDRIINHITTSSDCSKMVPVIIFDDISFLYFRLNKRAEKVEIEKREMGRRYLNYQIANIHNPKVKFAFCNKEWMGRIFCIEIRKMKE